MENNILKNKPIINQNTPVKPSDHFLRFMPSKKIQITLLVLLFIILIYAFRIPIISLFNRVTNRTSPLPTPTLVAPIEQPEIKPLSLDVDTDSDGLADWQETLLGTDPNKPNSKDEVPDSIRQLVDTSSKDLITTEDKLALKVYQRLQTSPVGENITQAIQGATTKEILDLANSLDKQLTTYTFDDLNIVDDTQESRVAYKNAIAAFSKSAAINEETSKEIYNALLTGQKSAKISTLQVTLTQLVTKLLTIPVPLKLSDEHLSIVNSLAHENDILTNNRNYTSESSLLYASLLVFQKNVNLARQTIDTIINKL